VLGGNTTAGNERRVWLAKQTPRSARTAARGAHTHWFVGPFHIEEKEGNLSRMAHFLRGIVDAGKIESAFGAPARGAREKLFTAGRRKNRKELVQEGRAQPPNFKALNTVVQAGMSTCTGRRVRPHL